MKGFKLFPWQRRYLSNMFEEMEIAVDPEDLDRFLQHLEDRDNFVWSDDQ